MRKKVPFKIDFADSEYKSLQISEDFTLVIYLSSWDEKIIKITFYNAIQFIFKLGDAITQGLYEIPEGSSFLEEALSREYEKIPSEHPFKLYQIQDIYDFPYIEVIAENINVEKISED